MEDGTQHSPEFLHGDITRAIIGAAFDVHNALGPGFLESVYEAALELELRRRGFEVERQVQLEVRYHGVVVGEFVADMMVNKVVYVENKAVETNHPKHEAQLLNVLAATSTRVGLLLNFGQPRLYYKRMVK